MSENKASYVIGFNRILNEDQLINAVSDCMTRTHTDIPSLARMSGVSDSAIRRWLSHKTTIKYSTMEKIVSALDILDRDFWRFYA